MAQLGVTIPSLKFNDGTAMPMLGYGTGTAWFKVGEERKIDQAIIDAVKMAIKLGYTHLDGAESTLSSYYGRVCHLQDICVPWLTALQCTKLSRSLVLASKRVKSTERNSM
jgi:hypothetical protein